jgi:hypothetical protein
MKKIGDSNLTVGRWGCTTTCLSMLSDYFKHFHTPGEIAGRKEFYANGLVWWKKLDFATMRFVERRYGRHDYAIRDSIKGPNKAVMLQVDNAQHWVVATSRTLWGNDYWCVDPWDGKERKVVASFGNITGSAHFVSKT